MKKLFIASLLTVSSVASMASSSAALEKSYNVYIGELKRANADAQLVASVESYVKELKRYKVEAKATSAY